MLHRNLRCGLSWLLLPAALMQAQTVPENGSGQLTAEEVLAQTTKAYTDLVSYSAEIASRTLQVVRPRGSATPPDQYQLTLVGHELITLRMQRPNNLFCQLDTYTDSTSGGSRSQSAGPSPVTTVLLKSDASPPRLYRVVQTPPRLNRANANSSITTNGRINVPGPNARGSTSVPTLTEESFKTNLINQLAGMGTPYFNAFIVPGQQGNIAYAPAFTGDGVWNGQPVYRLKIKRGVSDSEELWISKSSFLILRSISLLPRSLVVESVYKQTLGASFGDKDFVYEPQPPGPFKSAADLGIAEDKSDLLAFVTLPNQPASASPGAMAAAPATPAAPAPPEEQQISADQMAGVVMIEGNKGLATGFIAKVHDVPVIVTNLHVLGDNDKISIKTLQGDPIAVQGVIGAVGSDIALLRIAKPADIATAPLATADNVIASSKIGDKIVVVGNRLGGGVATQVSGRIIGLGPNRLEVDAAFQPGNSGSPIFNVANGEVLGVATYAETVTVQLGNTKSNPASRSSPADNGLKRETRWFGYRLDAVTKWESIDWSQWQAQVKQINAFRTDSMALRAFLVDDVSSARANPEMVKILDDFAARLRLPRNAAPAAKMEEVKSLVSALKAFANRGVSDLSNSRFYDYFRSSLYWETSVPDQLKFRSQIIDALKEGEAQVRSISESIHY